MAVRSQIGGIRIFAELQEGATTLVYKGYQPALDRVVLLKVLRPEFGGDPEVSRRFQEEARLFARVQHPNVVAVYDYGQEDEVSYFAAEFVDGVNLQELLASRSLPPDLASFVLLEVARGLKAAHDEHILHLDIKPSNILISQAGQVKLTDFGMAAVRDSSGDAPLGEVRGTLAYLSPEQVLGRDVGKSSDLFSLGATFYEMLMGTRPFVGREEHDYLEAIVNHDPLPLLRSRRDLPTELADICARLLAKEADQRYPDCDGLIADLLTFRRSHDLHAGSAELGAYLEAPEAYSSPKPEVGGEKSRPEERARETFGRRTGLLAGTVVVVGLIFYLLFAYNAAQERDPADSRPEAAEAEQTDRASEKLPSPADESTLAAVPASQRLQPAEREPRTVPAETISTDPKSSLDGGNTDSEPPRAPSEPAFGYLQVSCKPWAAVFVDGDSVAVTPMREPIRLSAGMHRLALKNPGFPEHEVLVDVPENGTRLYQVSLWSFVGQLELEVSPWAEVYIDGEYRDTTPLRDPLILEPGPHTLELRHPALGSWETEIDIKPGETLRLRFNLQSLLNP